MAPQSRSRHANRGRSQSQATADHERLIQVEEELARTSKELARTSKELARKSKENAHFKEEQRNSIIAINRVIGTVHEAMDKIRNPEVSKIMEGVRAISMPSSLSSDSQPSRSSGAVSRASQVSQMSDIIETPVNVRTIRHITQAAHAVKKDRQEKLEETASRFPEELEKLNKVRSRLTHELTRSNTWSRPMLDLVEGYTGRYLDIQHIHDPMLYRPQSAAGVLPCLKSVFTLEPGQGNDSWLDDEMISYQLQTIPGSQILPAWHVVTDSVLVHMFVEHQEPTTKLELERSYTKTIEAIHLAYQNGQPPTMFAADIPAHCTHVVSTYNPNRTHWVVAVHSVENGKGRIHIYDSMSTPSSAKPDWRTVMNMRHLGKHLSLNRGSAFSGINFEDTDVILKDCPQQGNAEDCGILAGSTASLIARGQTLPVLPSRAQKLVYAEELRWKVARSITTELTGQDIGPFAKTLAMATMLKSTSMTLPRTLDLQTILENEDVQLFAGHHNLGLYMANHLHLADKPVTLNSLLNDFTDDMLDELDNIDMDPQTCLLFYLQHSPQYFQECAVQTHVNRTRYSRDPVRYTTWELTNAFKPLISMDIVVELHSREPDEYFSLLHDDLYHPPSLLLCITRRSRGYNRMSEFWDDLHRTEELYHGYHARFSAHPEQRKEVKTPQDLQQALLDKQRTWMRVQTEPVGSHKRFLEANTPINESIKAVLKILDEYEAAHWNKGPCVVTLVCNGWDGITTNHDSWLWLQDNYPHLTFRITVATRHRPIGTEYGRQDGALPTLWHHFEVSELCKLLQHGRTQPTTDSHLSSDIHHHRFLVYMFLVQSRKIFHQAIERNRGTQDISFSYKFELLAATLSGPHTRKNVGLPRLEDRYCILCKRQDTVLDRAGPTAKDLKCANGCMPTAHNTKIPAPQHATTTEAWHSRAEIPLVHHKPGTGSLALQSRGPTPPAPVGKPDTGLYWCPVCHETMPVVEHEAHLHAHIKKTTAYCPIPGCHYTPTRRSTWNSYTHMREHEKAGFGRPMFKCEECGKQYAQRTQLTAHMAIHRGDIVCNDSECDNLTFTKSGLKDHQADIHAELYDKHKPGTEKHTHVCKHSTCKRRFPTPASLASHVAKGHSTKGPKKRKSTVAQTQRQRGGKAVSFILRDSDDE